MANQNQKFLGALIEHAPSEELSTDEKQYWIQHGTELSEVLVKALKRNLVAVAVASALLTFVGTVSLPATTETFVACEKFVFDTVKDAGVDVFTDNNFFTYFLSDGGKVEPAQSERELCYAKLERDSRDLPIIAYIGGEEKAETLLTDMCNLLKKQAHGGKGALLTNGYANIFYIRDSTGVLRTVRVCWRHRWRVRSDSAQGPCTWGGCGHQVFYHNSDLSSSETLVSAHA